MKNNWPLAIALISPFTLFACSSKSIDKTTASSSQSSVVTVPSSSESSASSSSSLAANLVINELVTKSDNPDFLAGNDWIEIYNGTGQTVNLSNYSLADATNPASTLPNIELNPGEYQIIAAVDSEDTDPPEPYVPFKLGSDDSLTLFQNDQAVSQLQWSVGDIPRSKGLGLVNNEVTTTEPTPGDVNIATQTPTPTGTSTIIINEILTKSIDDIYLAGNDWIELYNNGTAEVNLGGYYIADSNEELYALPAINLAGGAYLVIAAVDSDDTNPPTPSVPFKLGGTDVLSLYSGSELVAYLTWSSGEIPEGSSYGLVGDSYQVLTPSPGQAN